MADHGVPSADDNETTSLGPDGRVLCPVCWTPFTRIRRQLYCSEVCRKTAWRRRHTPAPAAPTAPPSRRRRDVTVYSCPECDTRYYGTQWCDDCQRPCTRVGLGGRCPACDEPVAVTDLLDQHPNPTEVIDSPHPLL